MCGIKYVFSWSLINGKSNTLTVRDVKNVMWSLIVIIPERNL